MLPGRVACGSSWRRLLPVTALTTGVWSAAESRLRVKPEEKTIEANASGQVPFRLPAAVPHCRSLWIGILQGTWREMGLQYGQRCGKDIARTFDLYWERDVLLSGASLWHVERSERERARYANEYLKRSYAELQHLRPELLDMFAGIAEGASEELDRCAHADACPHSLKIGLINFASLSSCHPDWDFVRDRAAAASSRDSARSAPRPGGDADCNGFWVKGAATRTGHTYASRAAQSRHIEAGDSVQQRQVSYVAVPDDPAAKVFWGNGRAGNLGGLGGGLMNDRGVCCLTSGAQGRCDSRDEMDAALAPGIRDFLLASAGVIFSETAEQATEMATVGTEDYRRRTGRSTVLRARGCNIVFADADSAFCIEQNARRYAVRRPGDLGEKGGNYLVHANHFKSTDGLFDEANVFHPDRAMARFCPEHSDSPDSSYFRFWSGMWMLRSDYGRIDDRLIREDLVASHSCWDEAGRRYGPDPLTGAPPQAVARPDDQRDSFGTFCAHMGPFTPESPLGVGGNAETTVFDLTTREVWWVPVWPCHYREWNLDWHYVDLKTFADGRRAQCNRPDAASSRGRH